MKKHTALTAAGLSLALVLAGGLAAHASPAGAAASAGKGCTNTATVPHAAVTGPIEDVDGDGRSDTQFYGVVGGTAGTGRHSVYGVQTAAGGVYTVTDTLKGIGVHSGWTANLDSAGTVSVIDDTKTAELYAFRHCRFVQPQHAAGGAYTFTLGAKSSTGTGVACNDQNGGPLLLRSTARLRSNGRYDILWAVLRVSDDGRVASRQSGGADVRWSNLKPSDARVREARGSHCKGIAAEVEGRLD